MEICKYCGKEMESHYDREDRMTWYECDCELSTKVESKKSEISQQKDVLWKLEQELKSLEASALYEVELRALNKKFGK